MVNSWAYDRNQHDDIGDGNGRSHEILAEPHRVLQHCEQVLVWREGGGLEDPEVDVAREGERQGGGLGEVGLEQVVVQQATFYVPDATQKG